MSYSDMINVIDIVLLNIPFMVVITCRECCELIYVTPHAFWNITDFGYKCPKCEGINTITLENGELRKQV
jgi:Zn finger protein HypA/HybF involved in hydrogenase expression